MFKNITIDKLIPTNSSESHSYIKGALNLNSISKDKFINDDPNINFNSNILLENIKKRRINIRTILINAYNLCYEKILDADKSGLTDIIFIIPYKIQLNSNLCKPIQILTYISEALEKESINTYIIDSTHLFITWKFLELNKESNKKLYK
jgi:hypothetical protein